MTPWWKRVDAAVRMGIRSPCLSKRGVVIWNDGVDGNDLLVSVGYNDQPRPFLCDRTESCKKTCGKTAIHAEQAAIINARLSLQGTHLLHVKCVDGKPCASGSPSCLECSKLILAAGISWVYLLQDSVARLDLGSETVGSVDGNGADGFMCELKVRRYSAQIFHWLTAVKHHKIDLAYA